VTKDEILALANALDKLTAGQQALVQRLVAQFALPFAFHRLPTSDWITDGVLHHLGDSLRGHHATSRQALSKDRFEFAFERALNLGGVKAELVKSRTNRGHDITIENVPVGLKTEASAGIKPGHIHISKWMELGKGKWDLPVLRDLFLEHMKGYARIFTLRQLTAGPKQFHYELVEIPKALLLEAANCVFEVKTDSKQNPQPGYGRVYGAGVLRYELYFDGGTERKLQIRKLDKKLCTVHATWAFEVG
jgi:hypothetical protein